MRKNQEIFTDLIEQNQGIIHKICRSYTDTKEQHQDMFQEIVLQLWQGIESFNDKAKFSSWLYKVALNTAITLFRKKKKQISTTAISQVPSIAYSEECETEEQIRLLYKAIKQLSEIERAITLLYLEDKNFKEIAETIGISNINARVKMNRIKSKLKKIMETLA